MKPRNLLIGLLLCVTSASAQDVITKTDGTKLDAKVEEITESVIKYRKASNPTGPVYSIPVSSVRIIVYENGSTDTFTVPSAEEVSRPVATESEQPVVGERMEGYIVKKNDTFQAIAKVHGVTVSELERTNPGVTVLRTGQVINIPLKSLAKVETPQSFTNPSDEELLRLSETMAPTTQASLGGNMSDLDLLRIYNPSYVIKEVAKYRKIGWIGGATILVVGVGVGALASRDEYGDINAAIFGGVGGGSVLLATAWCIGFNLKAKSLLRQARELEMYSSTLIENELLQFGDKSLMAGVNVMGSRLTHTQSLGLCLKLNF